MVNNMKDAIQRELITDIMNAWIPHLNGDGTPEPVGPQSGCMVRTCLRGIDYRMGNDDPYVRMLAAAGIARVRHCNNLYLLVSPKRIVGGALQEQCQNDGTSAKDIREVLLTIPDAVDEVKRKVGGQLFSGVAIPILYIRKIIKRY